jgi:hypothetical protein
MPSETGTTLPSCTAELQDEICARNCIQGATGYYLQEPGRCRQTGTGPQTASICCVPQASISAGGEVARNPPGLFRCGCDLAQGWAALHQNTHNTGSAVLSGAHAWEITSKFRKNQIENASRIFSNILNGAISRVSYVLYCSENKHFLPHKVNSRPTSHKWRQRDPSASPPQQGWKT